MLPCHPICLTGLGQEAPTDAGASWPKPVMKRADFFTRMDILTPYFRVFQHLVYISAFYTTLSQFACHQKLLCGEPHAFRLWEEIKAPAGAIDLSHFGVPF